MCSLTVGKKFLLIKVNKLVSTFLEIPNSWIETHKSSFEHLLSYLSLSISGPLECGVGSYKFILGAQGAPQKIFFGSSLDEQWACNGVCLGCLRLRVPNFAKFFLNRFYFVVIFCVQRIACRTKFMHLFGNLWVWDVGRAGRWIIGGYAIGVLQLLPKVACWPFAWAFDNSSFIFWWVTWNPPHLHWADELSWFRHKLPLHVAELVLVSTFALQRWLIVMIINLFL